jgi:TrmH family RNA methyltransferase
MISKNQIKFIRSLQTSKFRQIHDQYLVEGEKMLNELLNSEQNILHIYGLLDWVQQHETIIKKKQVEYTVVSESELAQISTLTTPNKVLAVVKGVKNTFDNTSTLEEGIYVVLENIQDPGNLGTIIRSAEWFGVKAIFCTANTVEVYNPKVVQASMGSVFRMKVYYTDIAEVLQHNAHMVSYAAVLGGENVYSTKFSNSIFLLVGNESKGLSAEMISITNHKITIPSYGKAESLNAAVACSVLLGIIRNSVA